MSDPRTFVLIGEFKDGITPELQKINNQLASLRRSFGNLGGKGARNASRDIGRFKGAIESLSESLKIQNQVLRSTIEPMRQYRREVGKTVGALKKLDEAGGRSIAIERTNKALAEQIRLMDQLRSRSGRGGAGSGHTRPPRGEGGGGYTRPPRDGGGNGSIPPFDGGRARPPINGTNYRGSVARDATFAFGQTLGYQLSNTITGSIVQGFQIGVGLMVKPFQYFMDGFSERVRDESTDVQTAGAMFAIAQRKNMGMFQNFNQAIRAQQAINYRLAESAAALPGPTTEYVTMGKRVLDSMMTVLSKDVKGVSAFAGELGARPGDKQDVLATLTQKFTEKAVLLGQGSTYRGNYGVPQLLEQLIGKENVSENMFNKFAMYRDLPIFQSVFKDMEGEIAKTGAYSADRIRLVFQLLDEALPNEVIQAHKNTMAGFIEATKSAFLDPEVGLFGMGRKIQGMEMAMVDQYGNFIDKQGKIVGSWDEAAKEQISLYESIQKILTGFGLPLSEFATYLPKIFEPFEKLVSPLENMFKVAQGFYRNFNIYTKEFENLAKSFSDRGLKGDAVKMKKSAGARGTLLAISNLLTTFGDMSGAKFKDISTKLQDPAADIASISKDVMTAVFNSSFIEQLGFQIGLLVGGVLSTVAELLGFAKGAGNTRIVTGLKSGFEAAGGTQAFKDIFTNFFSLVFKAVKDIFLMAPAQITALIGGALLLPSAMAGISVAIGNFIESVVDAQLSNVEKFKPRGKTAYTKPIGPLPAPALTPSQRLAGKTRNAGPGYLYSGVKPRLGVKGFLKGAVGADQSLLGRSVTNAGKNPLKAVKGIPVTIKNVAKGAFSAVRGGGLGAAGGGIKNLFGKGMKGLGKFGGIATAGVGIVEAIMSLLSGDNLGTALGKGAGPVLGTIIGTALLGPIGGVIGGMVGSMEEITQPLGDAFNAIGGALSTTFGLLAQIGGDLLGMVNGFVRMLPGVSKEFDILKFIVTTLLGPFRLLELMIIGLYEGYLRIKEKFFDLNDEEKAKKNELFQQRMQKTASLELDIKQAYNKKAREEYQKELDLLKSKGKGGEERARIVESALKLIDAKLKEKDPKYKPPSTTPATPKPSGGNAPLAKPKVGYLKKNGVQGWLGTDGTWTPLATATPPTTAKPIGTGEGGVSRPVGGQPAAPAKEIVATAQNTSALNQKAATQITQGAVIQKATDETKKNTTTANATLGNIKAGLMAISSKLSLIQTAILGDLNNIQAGVTSISSLLSSGGLKVQAQGVGPMGGPMGNATGNLGAAQSMASQYGLSMTSWFRPGDPGYHGKGRAMDFSNGVSTPQQMAFAQALASQYGSSIKQLIYTPLGYGISDGTVVPLSFWGPATNAMHYNHVHVAFANGLQDGKMFSSQSAAGGWENSMVPGSVKVASITGNSAESFGGSNFGNINVTVNAGATSDPDTLASIVALKISEAVSDARAASIFV
jgi:hypothetical protein